MSEKKEEKQVKVNLSFTSEKLFTYGAIAAAVLGLVLGICGAVGNSGAAKAGGFFWGIFWAILGGLVLYGLSQIVKSKQ
jgi:hypothetical protein